MIGSVKRMLNNRKRGFAFTTSTLAMLLALSSFAVAAQAGTHDVDRTAIFTGNEALIQASTSSEIGIDAEVNKTLDSGKAAFLYFYADWCPFCQKQKPIVDELERKYNAVITFIRVNGSDEPQAMDKFGVTGFPTMFFISERGADGEYVYQQYGSFTDEQTLMDNFDVILEPNGGAGGAFAARAETLCSYAGPDSSPDSLQLTDFKVVGQTPLKVGDTITVSFKLQNLSGKDINLGAKGIFVAATDPNNSDASFGSTYPPGRQATFAASQTISVQASRALDKPGNWTVWPSYQLATAARQMPKFGPGKWHACSLTVQTAVAPPPTVTPPPTTPPTIPSVIPKVVVPRGKATVKVPFPEGMKDINLPYGDWVTEGPSDGYASAAFQDGDNDTVNDLFDECPNTPPGVPVYNKNGCRCRDTDGGINPYVKGTVEVWQDNYEDKCALGFYQYVYTVEEKYCNPDYETGKSSNPVSTVNIDCPICDDGKCLKGPCSSPQGTCGDKIKNQDETGVDCGGGMCPPCNTKCKTGTFYAPPDTPCTRRWDEDPHKVDYTWGDSEYEFVCNDFEVCHSSLDNEIIEALKCCSATSPGADPSARLLCRAAISASGGNCKKCVGLYLIKGLGTYAKWMKGYKDEWNVNGDPTNPPTTAGWLLTYYKTGVCRHYALALTTLLRKAGYTQEEVGYFADGIHAFNIVKLPGDTKWHVVDTTGNGHDITLGGLPGGYPYCFSLDESKWWYKVDFYNYTGPIPDVSAYWDTVSKGQQYSYWIKGTVFDMQKAKLQGEFVRDHLPECGPGVACYKDVYQIPAYAPVLNQIVGCGGP